jgi:hypothetical protein
MDPNPVQHQNDADDKISEITDPVSGNAEEFKMNCINCFVDQVLPYFLYRYQLPLSAACFTIFALDLASAVNVRRSSMPVGATLCYLLSAHSHNSSRTCFLASFPVLWIRIGFVADPDPAFYLNEDPGPGSHTNADPDPVLIRLCHHKNSNINKFYVGNRS